MNTRRIVLVAAALLCRASVASAATPDFGRTPSPAPEPAAVTQVSDLIGSTVANLQGHQVGSIKDILLDSATGRASFVILDAEIPGSGRAMLVVPYQALQMGRGQAAGHPDIVLDLRPENLHAAPQIQNNQRQLLQNPQFLQQAQSFYGPVTYTAARPIDNGSFPPPALRSAEPQPCTTVANPWSGWSQDLIDFYNE